MWHHKSDEIRQFLEKYSFLDTNQRFLHLFFYIKNFFIVFIVCRIILKRQKWANIILSCFVQHQLCTLQLCFRACYPAILSTVGLLAGLAGTSCPEPGKKSIINHDSWSSCNMEGYHIIPHFVHFFGNKIREMEPTEFCPRGESHQRRASGTYGSRKKRFFFLFFFRGSKVHAGAMMGGFGTEMVQKSPIAIFSPSFIKKYFIPF